MQTFLPSKSFYRTSKILDPKRLGKQRVEAFQILNVLEGHNPNSRWRNHVAVRMWKGYENCLKHYFNHMIKEWVGRGNKNNMNYMIVYNPIEYPPWLDDPRLTMSHRGNLMRKDPFYYSRFEWEADPEAPYWWPVPMKTPAKQKTMIEYWGE